MPADHWILLGAWALFGFTHSLMAREWFISLCRSVMGRYFVYYRLIYSSIALLSLAAVLVWQFSLPAIIFAPPPLFRWLIGLPGGLLGIVLMGKCIHTYFLLHSGVGVFYKRSRGPAFISKGIHRYVRHPLYLGTLLLIWSLFLFFPSLGNFIACGMITLYTLIGIRLEESKLLRQFGQAYADYRRQTPMLIPRTLQLKWLRGIKAFFQL